MPSPFPGMDPYIESCGLWDDFHGNLIGDIQRQLAERVPDRYVVRGGERSYIVLEPKDVEPEERRAQADVAVLLSRESVSSLAANSTAVLEAVTSEPPPVELVALIESEFRESFIDIYATAPDRKLVTTIEVLSLSNKRYGSHGWDLYVRKRQAHLSGGANLVEIDLLRGGRRMPMADEWPDSPYYMLVSRKPRTVRCTVWPAHFVRPLPVIPVPLEPPDPDVSLNIQPLIEQIYERSRYARDIDYHKPCRPRFSPAESAWFESRLQELQAKS